MVVVAIIGLLAAIAIPQYSRFQKRAIQTEAKTGLSGLFVAQKTFITEWNFASSDMNQLGFAIDGNQENYAVGFFDNTGNTRDASANPAPNDYRGPEAPATRVHSVGKAMPAAIGSSGGNRSTAYGGRGAATCTTDAGGGCTAASGAGCRRTNGADGIAGNTDDQCEDPPTRGLFISGANGINYLAGAIGYLGTKTQPDDDDLDIWVIDHARVLAVRKDGTDSQ